MIRNPVVAGQFYPSSPVELRRMIETFIEPEAPREEVIGLLAPHAGYIYSGPVAGATLSRIKTAETYIIMCPSHTGRGKPLSIMTEGTWKTPLGNVAIDSDLAQKILSVSQYLQEDSDAHQSEHGVEVQLPFLQVISGDFEFVPVVLSYATNAIYKQVGKEIARAIKDYRKKVIIFASGDMTHYESQEVARKKDMQAVDAVLNLDEDELARRNKVLNMTVCAFPTLMVLISAAKELGATQVEMVKYQNSGDASGDYSAVVGYAGVIIKGASPLVRLAKNTVETYVKEGRAIKPEELTPEMKEKAGVFVSIKKKGQLRGCIGTFEPTTKNVALEVITNAISSATRDPRFPPVTADELADLSYSVDVLTAPEPVDSAEQLDPKKYGVIVESGWRRGLLLPDLEGVDSVDYQIDICRQKGGIGPNEPVKLYRFEVKRYK
jgi:AmmeMemoRadiSam system protein B/AmmeMemoRadiSam system protein A